MLKLMCVLKNKSKLFFFPLSHVGRILLDLILDMALRASKFCAIEWGIKLGWFITSVLTLGKNILILNKILLKKIIVEIKFYFEFSNYKTWPSILVRLILISLYFPLRIFLSIFANVRKKIHLLSPYLRYSDDIEKKFLNHKTIFVFFEKNALNFFSLGIQ